MYASVVCVIKREKFEGGGGGAGRSGGEIGNEN